MVSFSVRSSSISTAIQILCRAKNSSDKCLHSFSGSKTVT